MDTRDFIPDRVMTSGAVSPLSKDHLQRHKLMSLYWDYYRGRHRKNIKVKPNQADDNITVNWSKKIVNAGVSFLFGKEPTFQIDQNTDDRTPAEQYLDSVFEDDPGRSWSFGAFLTELAQSGAVSGTAVVRLYPQPDGPPDIAVIDPANVDIITAQDNIKTIVGYHIIWRSSDQWKRHRIEQDESELAWTIHSEILNSGNRWIPADDPEAWEYDFPPIVHCQNLILAHSVWGVSDLEDADLNDAVNMANSNINRILRFHAHPKTVGTGFAASQINVAADGLITLPPGSTLNNLEMESDLMSSVTHRGALEEAFHQVADVPRLDPAQVNLGALSGFALQILYAPLLAKTDLKRITYGGLLQRLCKALLVIGGFENDNDVSIHWENPLPANENEKYQRFQILVASGVAIWPAAMMVWKDSETADMLAEVDLGMVDR